MYHWSTTLCIMISGLGIGQQRKVVCEAIQEQLWLQLNAEVQVSHQDNEATTLDQIDYY